MTSIHCRPRAARQAVRLTLLLGAVFASTSNAFATNWYVDGLNGGPSSAGTLADPFLSFWQASRKSLPGDTIYLLPTVIYPHINMFTPGVAGLPITISGTGLPPNMTHIAGTAANFAVQVSASYVNIMNFDLTAPASQTALQVPAGIHHVTIANNVVHDAGGDGISTAFADYITISHNVVYGNAHSTANHLFGSGISTKSNTDIDGSQNVKIIVDGNIVYANTNVPSCTPQPDCLATASDSDGNGIIVDDLRHTESDHIAYRGGTLVSNNVVFGNGGRGIHIFQSDNVTVSGNTAYFNNQDPYEGNYRPGEVTVDFGGNIHIYNNILFSDGGKGINNGQRTGTHVPMSFLYCNQGPYAVMAQFNLAYDATNSHVRFYGKGNTIPIIVSQANWGDPGFEVASLDPSVADFRVRPGSPALGAANPLTALATDILGVARTVPVSLGAYQNPGP